MPSATYRSLLRTPGAAAFFLSACLGRVGLAMTGLGMVWLVHARTGSYGDAGLVTGCFAVTDALAGPQLGRLVDRFGQTRTLPGTVLAHAGAVALLVTGAVPDPVAGALVGATLPQISAFAAARWSALLHDGPADALPRAYALESLANGLSFLAGPALVSAAGAAGHPRLGTLLAAALVVCGGLALAAQRRTAPPVEGRAARKGAGRALFSPAFARLVAITLVLGVYFGAQQVSIGAYAVRRGTPALAPVLYAVSNCTSLVGGWLYGLRRWRSAPVRQRTVVCAALAAVVLPLTVLDAPLPVAVCLALTGFAVPPLLILFSLLTESTVPRAVLTQAFTWGGSASAAGIAVSGAVAGRAVDVGGAHGGFLVSAVATVGMTLISAWPRRTASRLAGARSSPRP
ncbi:MFS transporter [Streptomyces sp. VRA16 Mangrove soil]|uniref:MFS transporter n=1 Tax=Streptomyces sp. VRA16 Mangrove soil TaxID=2817434 RepID=UPI001A9F4526|nr:MFS transporter [Streptomyces sp. VRA16 Mangrove soil]MBO1336857.1 MFS transporter [Streptomyces sp. VRA16 Mangrove soil]